MTEVLVWLLIAMPSDYRAGLTHVVERFKTQTQCEHVLKNASNSNDRLKCIQANIIIGK